MIRSYGRYLPMFTLAPLFLGCKVNICAHCIYLYFELTNRVRLKINECEVHSFRKKTKLISSIQDLKV